MRSVQLNDGNYLPMLGFGTYKAKDEAGVKAITEALHSGYRLIDTAAKYDNEREVGKAIKQSTISREELHITTKLWRENLGYDATLAAFDESLNKLGLDYIDLYLIHWPANKKNYGKQWQQANADVWRAMETLQAAGKIKSIGISNFWQEHLDALLQTAKVIPAINQVEFHPGYWQPDLVAYCKGKGIVVQSWSPLAKGKVFGNEVLHKISAHHNKNIAQVCLRWAIQHEVIVIPKTTTKERIKANTAIFDFELSAEEMTVIDQMSEMGFSGELPNEWPDKVL
ncbi:MAG: aldo/keto reductase [Sphingobacteriales bacterium]|nr:MAG: aldo/keto reductase [Sphingobacteriales bacterium]